MQKLILSLLLAATVFSVSAQNIIRDKFAQVRRVNTFDKIKVSGALSVYLSQGSEQGVVVSTEDGKYNDKIITEVKDGTLKIYVESGGWNKWNWGNREIKAYVTVKNIHMLDVTGASSVKLVDPITSDDLHVELTGASTIKGSMKIKDLHFHLTGASNADITGSTERLSIQATGASSFKGYEFASANCKIEATGASSIHVTVHNELEAYATGASSVGYKGEAVITKINVTGASTVKKKDS